MIWIFVLAIGIAMTFTTLGAFFVWLKVLSLALKVAVFLFGLFSLFFVWRYAFSRKASVAQINDV